MMLRLIARHLELIGAEDHQIIPIGAGGMHVMPGIKFRALHMSDRGSTIIFSSWTFTDDMSRKNREKSIEK